MGLRIHDSRSTEIRGRAIACHEPENPPHQSGAPRRQPGLGASAWAERLRVLGEDQKAPLAVNLSPAVVLTGACGRSSEVGPGSGFLLSP